MHERLETTIPLLSPLATETTYATYLAALLGFHRPLERSLHQIDELNRLPLDMSQRWKSAPLSADLQTLDRTDTTTVPDCPAVPSVRDLPRALGCMYVLDGATLGGRVIYTHLVRRFPNLMAHSARYLQVYGASTRLRWDQLCSVLASRPASEHDAMVEAALRTFHALEAWVDAYAVPRWRAEGLAG